MNPQRASKAYALELLAQAVQECRRAGLVVTTSDERHWLVIRVQGAHILKDSDETFILGDDDEVQSLR